MTDAKALSIVRKFIEEAPGEDARVQISLASGGTWVAQRTGGELPALIRAGNTLGEAVDKLFEETSYAE